MAEAEYQRPFIDLPDRDHFVRPAGPSTNPLYPLPAFYNELAREEDRAWWRVNACCIQETPADFVVAFTFFFYTYLWPKGSMFLKNRREYTASHFQLIHDLAAYRFNGFSAPRFFYKSFLLLAAAMLLALTRRGYTITYFASTQQASRDKLEKVKEEFETNDRLLHDFGQMAPKRGQKRWNVDRLSLARPFFSNIFGAWMKGGHRGGRTDWLIFDDVEIDPSTDEVVPENTARVEATLGRYMPFIEIAADDLLLDPDKARRGQAVTYGGTIIREDMFLPRVVSDNEASQFEFWCKNRFDQERDGWYLWPARWGPAASRLMREIMSDDVYDREQLGRPGATAGKELHIHPVFNTYVIDQLDEELNTDPFHSRSLVRWATRISPLLENASPVWHKMLVCDWVSTMDIALLIDWNDVTKVSGRSDFGVGHIVGLDSDRGAAWSLDLRMDRYKLDDLIDDLVELCLIWKPRQMVMEDVFAYGTLCDIVYDALREPLLNAIGWLPVPIKKNFNSRFDEKGLRIRRNKWRFKADRIYFPAHRRTVWPYSEMWYEIENFTVKLERLKHDDAVDTLGLLPYTFRGQSGYNPDDKSISDQPVMELLEKGILYSADGFPLARCVNTSSLTEKAERSLAGHEGQGTAKQTFWRRRQGRRTLSDSTILSP